MYCRICGYEGREDDFEEDYVNRLGYWCPYCDSFSYLSDENHKQRQFLLWLEDIENGKPLTEKKMLKQNVSPLRYPGGKTKLVPYVAARIPEGTKRIVEPFCGGASVSLACLMAGLVEEIHINDMESGVVNLFQTILLNPDWLIHRLYGQKADRATYFQYRNSLLSQVPRP